MIEGMLTPGIHPFWFWNTAIDEALIRRQVRALADGGCRGALISARQGFPGAYLSARWRELVAVACREGAALGLEMGVADEFPYPSGNAGGLAVLGRPEHWATGLTQRSLVSDGGAVAWDLPAGAVLDCAAFPLAGEAVDWSARRELGAEVGVVFRQETYRETDRDLSAYNGRRYFACDPAPRLETVLPSGRWLLVASLQTVALHHKYVGPSADTLDPAAMAAFITATHRRYEGVPLRALFVDEICAATWSRHLPAWYREQTGADLAPLLPALLRDDHPQAATVRATVERIREQRFRTAFLDPVRAWCRLHQVTLCEERPTRRLADAGADLPGCDPGHTRVGAPRHDLLGTELRRNARAAGSAGAGAALCECGHSLGWGATLEDLRAIVDGLLLHGITHIVPHAAFASTAALRKHDAPPSFFVQQSWWHLHRLLATRTEAVLAALAGSAPETELLVPPGTSEEVQHLLMERGYEWAFADAAPACDPARLPPPRQAPWSGPAVHRRLHRSTALLINQSRAAATVHLPAGWQPLALDGAAPEAVAGGWRLEPAQAMLAAAGAPVPPALPHHDLAWPERWRVRALGGNLLRLGDWRLEIAGQTAATSHFPLSEQLRRTGLRFAPAIDPGFGTPTSFALPALVCRYETSVQLAQAMPLRLLMEAETLVEPGWSIVINDGPPLTQADFAACAGLCEPALGCAIGAWLRPGANRIVVTAPARRADGGLRNPLYLHGDMAVLPDRALAPAIGEAGWGDLAGAGLPFACGTLEWEADISLTAASGPAALRLPRLAVDAYEVALDDGPWLAVPWAPRRVVLPAGWSAGRHRLRIRQHLPLSGCFHGEGWDAAAHRVVPCAPQDMR